MKIGNFVRIKTEYAFTVNPIMHYGEIIDIGLKDDIKINFDRRYNHDSCEWVDSKMYEIIK